MPTRPPLVAKLALNFSLALVVMSAQAAVDLKVLGTAYSDPDTLSKTDTASPPPGSFQTSGTLGASGSRVSATLSSFVVGSTSGYYTWNVLSAQSVVASSYEAFGLAPGARVDFAWLFSGSRTASVDNATLAIGANVGIYNKSGPVGAYIYNVSWGISYSDAPPAEGNFAGQSSNPWGLGGVAGNPADFGSSLPAGLWDGLSPVGVVTTYHLETGSKGDISLSTGQSIAGGVNDSYLSGTLISATVASASMLSGGPAYLLLDNGVQIPITAVPEPSAALMWLAGGLMLAGAGWRRRRG